MTQEPQQHRVVSRGGQLLFAGTEEDARAYVENNFPRVHVQPGSVNEPEHDAHVLAPDGTKHHYYGADGGGWRDESEDDEDAFADDSDNDDDEGTQQ